MDQIEWEDFTRVELRVGRVVESKPFPEARKPAYVLEVDFGPEVGTLKATARLTGLYDRDELVGRLVVGCVNLPPKQVGPHRSECLITGFPDAEGRVALCVPDAPVPPGAKLF